MEYFKFDLQSVDGHWTKWHKKSTGELLGITHGTATGTCATIIEAKR